MTDVWSKHVALLKNKKECAEVYCVTLIELQAYRDALIHNTHRHLKTQIKECLELSIRTNFFIFLCLIYKKRRAQGHYT